MGADIVVGEGQSIGNALTFGGPYVGLFATREKYVRQMPGRLCGETVDADGRRGFVLTLSTREQHIRREKATSNICTNSGLCALAFTIHMTLLGEAGLRRLARINHANAVALADMLGKVPGVERAQRHLLQRVHDPRAGRCGRGDREAGRRRACSAACRPRGCRPTMPSSADLIIVACHRGQHRRRPRSLREGAEGGAEMSRAIVGRNTKRIAPCQSTRAIRLTLLRPTPPVAGRYCHAEPTGPADGAGRGGGRSGETFTGNRGLAIEEALIFEIGRTDTTGVDLAEPAKFTLAPRRARAQGADRPAGPHRARGHAPLRAPVPEELRHRHRAVPARLLHHEAQPAPQREHGAAAGLRRHPSAAAALDRAGRHRADRRAVALAAAS